MQDRDRHHAAVLRQLQQKHADDQKSYQVQHALEMQEQEARLPERRPTMKSSKIKEANARKSEALEKEGPRSRALAGTAAGRRAGRWGRARPRRGAARGIPRGPDPARGQGGERRRCDSAGHLPGCHLRHDRLGLEESSSMAQRVHREAEGRHHSPRRELRRDRVVDVPGRRGRALHSQGRRHRGPAEGGGVPGWTPARPAWCGFTGRGCRPRPATRRWSSCTTTSVVASSRHG